MRQIDRYAMDQVRCFRRAYRANQRLFKGPLDLIPLMNVVLLFLLFFIIQSPFVLQPGIIVNLPASSFAAGVPFGPLVVTVSQEGLFFFNDERTTLEELGDALAKAVLDHPDSSLVIEADEGVLHRTLVQIYNLATTAGIKRVLLATRISSAGNLTP